MNKKLLKKLAAAATVTALVASMAAGCGAKKEEPKQEEKQLRVAVIQLIDNGAFEDMRNGFIAEMRAKGYDESKMEIIEKNAQGDTGNLNTICQTLVDEKVDLVATIATPTAQAMVAQESDIPVVFISVSNPVGAGIITDMAKPDKNATGTSNAIPISTIFELSEALTPGMQTYGLLYCTSEVNSVTTINQAKEYLDANGLKYVEQVVTNSSEVQQAAQAFVGAVDAIFVPNDSVIQAAMPQVAEIARDAKIPVYGSSAVMVKSGCLATVAITDTEIGAISADMAIQVLEGTPIADIPAQVVPANAIVVNSTTAELLGLEVPATLGDMEVQQIAD